MLAAILRKLWASSPGAKTRIWRERAAWKGGCSQDWLPHNKYAPVHVRTTSAIGSGRYTRSVRLAGVLLVSALISAAQIPPQNEAVLRGVILERDAQTDGGEFSVRVLGSQVIRYRFDAKTYVEREERPIDVPRLRPGEKVEVVSDPLSGSLLRYARTIHVIDPVPPPRIATRPGSRLDPTLNPSLNPGLGPPHEPPFPRGGMTFSGVVSRLSDGRLVVRTRNAGEQTILLRQNTRFVADGETVAAAELKTNMRVFVRAGKDVFGHVEAYQVVWGGILLPPEM
jgi:hypothetical protein